MKEVTFTTEPVLGEGRNGLFNQTGIEVWKTTGAGKGDSPQIPVIQLAGLHSRGVARGHVQVPLQDVPAFVRTVLAEAGYKTGLPDNTPRPLPEEFHGRTKVQEVERLNILVEAGYTVHRSYFANDGWADGADSLQAIVEKKDKLSKVKLGDNGRWYERTPGGGWSLMQFGADFNTLLDRILQGYYSTGNGTAQFKSDLLNHYGWEHEETYRRLFRQHSDLQGKERYEEVLGDFVKAIN